MACWLVYWRLILLVVVYWVIDQLWLFILRLLNKLSLRERFRLFWGLVILLNMSRRFSEWRLWVYSWLLTESGDLLLLNSRLLGDIQLPRCLILDQSRLHLLRWFMISRRTPIFRVVTLIGWLHRTVIFLRFWNHCFLRRFYLKLARCPSLAFNAIKLNWITIERAQFGIVRELCLATLRPEDVLSTFIYYLLFLKISLDIL